MREVRPWLVCCVALLPVLGAYANAPSVGFMWDDQILIQQNVDVHTLHAPWTYLTRVFWQHAFMYGEGHAFYRPLVNFSFALDWQAWGGAPAGFHVTNLLLHLAVCALVFSLAVSRGANVWSAGACTALFGVMPRLTESVTWIAGRTDVLAALFVLLALQLSPPGGARGWGRSLAVLGLLFLGLLSKEVALVGALVLVAEALLRVRARQSTWRGEAVTLGAVGVAVVAWLTLRAGVSSSAPLRLHDANTFLAGVGTYVWMLLTPWNPHAQLGLVFEPEPWAVVLGLVSSVLVGWLLVRLWRSAAWRAVWLGGAAAGVVMVTLLVLTVYTMASDRFLYLPLALLAVVVAQARWSRAALLTALAVVVVFSALTFRRNEVWADPLRFWRDVVATAHPGNPGAIAGLGDALFDLHRFEEARARFERAEAMRVWPGHSPWPLSIAVTDSSLGNDVAALARLEPLVRDEPKWRRAAYSLVLVRARAGDFAGAREALQAARARFGDDEFLRDLEQRVRDGEAGLTSADALTRARALHTLAATRKAEAEYLRVENEEAWRWLVIYGAEAHARAAAAKLPGDEGVQAELNERFPPGE